MQPFKPHNINTVELCIFKHENDVKDNTETSFFISFKYIGIFKISVSLRYQILAFLRY